MHKIIFKLKIKCREFILFLIPAVIFFLFSCNASKTKSNSYWESQKKDFKYHNLTEFVSDSTLKKDIISLHKGWHKSIDTITSTKDVYFYSWQERDSTLNEFTVVHDQGELGLEVYYVITDKNDKLISVTDFAGKGMEAGYTYELRSKFVGRDSVVQVQSVTQMLDIEHRKEADKPLGDSTFSYLIIDRNGHVKQKIFREMKELNYFKK